MTRTMIYGLGMAVMCTGGAQIAAQEPSERKAEIVSVTGCVKESASNSWVLVNATDPVPSPNGSVTVNLQSAPAIGKNRFRLIGVAAFKLPTRKDQTVIVQGLLVKAAPESRLNVTSVATLSNTCAEAPK